MKDRLIDGYSDYLRPCDFFDDYQMLLIQLNEIPFRAIREMDKNQIRHGEEFRERIANHFGIRYNCFLPVSCLEVLMSLADRFSTVLFVPGDLQFEGMCDILSLFLENMGLTGYDDNNFKCEKIDEIVNRWLDLKYCRDGTKGNIVCKPGYNKLKDLDIWMQLNKVLIPNFDENEDNSTKPVRHPYVQN